MLNISAFIITKNEATRIARAINSVKDIVEEVIVVDSGSTDDTAQIARNLGVKVISNGWNGYVKQKTFGKNLCQNDWILNIDADEELSKELQDEIEFIFASNNQDNYLAYRTKIVTLHRNDDKIRCFAPYNKCIRLYNRKYSSFSDNNITTHDSVLFNLNISLQNKIYDLNGIIYRRLGTSIEQLVAKANCYSSEQAENLVKLGRSPSKTRIVTETMFYFFKSFFIRRYWVFGLDGFVDSMIFAFARFIRLAKARELLNNKKDDNNIEA
ncbi:glycosyltransferase family 2 protein [Candidatus Tisiphia endosymbiont of Myopa tessellatipennis]|uniref:glycosyltransferase family 2 protein n=1 Tax=Candidatus Tisiphia endosymbiont of Myopa tessellatipennis TaxID=3066257 RepID=UPI00313D5B85